MKLWVPSLGLNNLYVLVSTCKLRGRSRRTGVQGQPGVNKTLRGGEEEAGDRGENRARETTGQFRALTVLAESVPSAYMVFQSHL